MLKIETNNMKINNMKINNILIQLCAAKLYLKFVC